MKCLLVATFCFPGVLFGQWEQVGAGLSGGGARSLLYDEVSSKLYCLGSFLTAGSIDSPGASYYQLGTWSGMSTGIPQANIFPVLSGVIVGTDSILVSGMFMTAAGIADTKRVAMWNGANWLSVGPVGASGPVLGFSHDVEGITAVGVMDTIGAVTTNRIARYTLGAWQNTCAFPVSSAQFVYTSTTLFNEKRIVAGNFNDSEVKEIGWLDDDTVRQLGQGIAGDAWVNDLKEFQGKLFIAGQFNAAAGNAATSLCTWDGQQFGNPFTVVQFITQATDLDVRNGELYFSGRTQLQGSADYYTLGRFDGERLCLFGKNLNTVFLAIAATEEYLYVAPNMITLGLGGDTVNYIARWDLSFPGDTCIQIATVIQESELFGADWAIAPTPFIDEIRISCASGIPSGSRLVLTDAAGRVLSEERLTPAGPNEQVVLNPRPSTEGVVIATIRDRQGGVLTRKRLIRISH